MNNFNHKFRSNLRAHCKIRHEDTVLVYINGKNSSMSLLHLIYNTFHGENKSNRKMFFKISILYIEDTPLYFEDYKEKREDAIKLISVLCEKYGFNLDIITIENLFLMCDKNIDNKELSVTNQGNIDKLYVILKHFTNNGDFSSDLIHILKQNFVFSFALKNSFTKVNTFLTLKDIILYYKSSCCNFYLQPNYKRKRF